MNRLLGFFLLFVCYLISAQEIDFSNYRWTTIEASGSVKARHESSLVLYKDKFYLLGGRGVNPVNVFDPKTNTWVEKKKTPFDFHHFQAVAYGDAIWIVGAMSGGYPKEIPLENIWLYYPEKDMWEKGPEIPVDRRRGGAGAVVYNDKIYLVCGIDFGHTSGTNNQFDEFDPKTGEWKVLTKAPHIRDHFSVIVVEDKLYCIGGRNTSFHLPKRFGAFFEQTMSFVDVYDFNEGKWHTMESKLPYPTAAGGLVNIGNQIFYAGGEGKYPMAYNQTSSLNIETGKWAELAPLSTGRHGGGAVVYDNKIYMAAGSPKKGGGNLASIEVFLPDHDWKPLFNGKSLEGWSVYSTEEDKEKEYWRVEDGIIVCDSKGRKDHDFIWLQHNDIFDDFELRLKFKSLDTNKGNSGVQVRSNYDPKAKMNEKKNTKGWMDGPQIDIDPIGQWKTGFIHDGTREHPRWIYPNPNGSKITEEYKPKRVIYFKENQGPEGWNDLRIICNGTKIITYLNNVLVSDYDGEGVLNDKDHRKHGVGLSGHIALQLHRNQSNQLLFKDIEIRELN